MHPRVPDFFIVGHPKCGTTALYHALRLHPEIYMPAGKEPRFFETEPGAEPAQRPPSEADIPSTLQEYVALFGRAPHDACIGEASSTYLVSRFAASRIAEVRPDARIIAIFREPASFVRSHHLQNLQTHIENEKDLRQAIALEPARREGKLLPPHRYWAEMLQYSAYVRYVEQLERYYSRFPSGQVMVLIYDDFLRDNDGTIRRVLRFLGVDDTVTPAVKRHSNPTIRVRAQPVNDLIHTLAVGEGPLPRAVRATVGAVTPRSLSRQSALAIRDRIFFAKPRPADEGLVRELRARYRDEVFGLSAYLQRDLVSLWGYGKSG